MYKLIMVPVAIKQRQRLFINIANDCTTSRHHHEILASHRSGNIRMLPWYCVSRRVNQSKYKLHQYNNTLLRK